MEKNKEYFITYRYFKDGDNGWASCVFTKEKQNYTLKEISDELSESIKATVYILNIQENKL